MYQVLRPSTSRFLPIRHHEYHMRQWSESTQPTSTPVVLLHGWMDVSASWQFMVDALPQSFMDHRSIVAPDWRGYGQTTGPATDAFWFPDYLGDLDALLETLYPGQQVDLVGHSMGGNVVMMYAAVRPLRVRRLVNVEGFGMAATRAAQAPTRLGQWLDELNAHQQGSNAMQTYPDLDAVAARLRKNNPRLAPDRAQWLASHWAQPDAQGQWQVCGDRAHKNVNPYLYRLDETLEAYRRIQCPTLFVQAQADSLTQWWKGTYTRQQHDERLQHVPQLQTLTLPDAGHMLQHDQPQRLAQALVEFLS